jgi:hypothetical protein
MCTYLYRKRANFVYIFDLLVSLSGGIQTILQFLIPLIVRFFLKKRAVNIQNVTTNATVQISLQSKLIKLSN